MRSSCYDGCRKDKILAVSVTLKMKNTRSNYSGENHILPIYFWLTNNDATKTADFSKIVFQGLVTKVVYMSSKF